MAELTLFDFKAIHHVPEPGVPGMRDVLVIKYVTCATHQDMVIEPHELENSFKINFGVNRKFVTCKTCLEWLHA